MKRLIVAFILLLIGALPLESAYSTMDAETQKEFNQILDEAFNAYLNNDYTKSMKLFQRALQIVPGDRTAEKGLKETQEKLEESQKEKLKMVKQRTSLIRENLKDENWMDAIDNVNWLQVNSPNPAEAQMLRGEVEELFRKKMANYPIASADRLIYEGLISYLNRFYIEALRTWKDARTLVPGNAKIAVYVEKAEQIYRDTVYYEVVTLGGQRAKDAFNGGNFEAAIEAWKKILELEPQNSEALEGIAKAQEIVNKKSKEGLISEYYDKGLSLFLEEKYEESLKYWEGIVAFDPNNEVAKDYIHKIKEKGITASVGSLEVSTQTSVQAEPPPIEKKVSASYSQALSLFHQEKYESSKELFKKAIQENPNDTDAKEWLKKAIQTQKDKAEDHYNKGLIAYSQGKSDIAIREWEKALEIDPNHGPTKRTLTKVKATKGGTSQ